MRHLLFGQGNRIGRRLIVLIIGFSSLITLVLSAAQLALEYRELRSGMDRELDGVAIYAPTIAGSLWDFDDKQIRVALESLTRLPNVIYVSVNTPREGRLWEAGNNASGNVVSRNFSLRHAVRGEETEIGTLQVDASLDAIFRQVAGRALSIVLSNGLKTFLVAIFMTLIFGRLVTGRLDRLQKEVVAMGQHILPLRESLGLASVPKDLDEIDSVAWRLEHLSRDLAGAVAALRESELRFATVFRTSPVGIALLRLDTRTYVDVNDSWASSLGYRREEVIGREDFALGLWSDPGKRQAVMEQLRSGKEVLAVETAFRRRSGELLDVSFSGSLVDVDGQPHVVEACADISERKRAEKEIHSLAFFDPLTRLPNRRLMLDRLQQSMAASSRSPRYRALLFLDLDNFKTLNDAAGHAVGDLLLLEVAQRLQASVRDGDTVARLGGDEFVIILEQLSERTQEAAAQAEAVGEKIIARLGETYQLNGNDYHGTTSLGITLFRGQDIALEELLKRADLAMYEAKAGGRNTLRFFDPAMQANITTRLVLENELQQALSGDQFELYYQPQVNAGERCIGVEALIRWNSPTRGQVLPGEFIVLAEESALILQIGHWVLRQACAQLAAWAGKAETAALVLAVNVSARQFRQPDFVAEVQGLLAAAQADPARLKLELTESMLLDDVDDVIIKMTSLRQLGVTFSLDDFGTGYSSLSYLKRLPLHQLKIDKSFVRDVLIDPNDAAISRAIIALGKSLGLHIVAEGVEQGGQWDFLRAEGCDFAQGYLHARPMPASELGSWLALNAQTCTEIAPV